MLDGATLPTLPQCVIGPETSLLIFALENIPSGNVVVEVYSPMIAANAAAGTAITFTVVTTTDVDAQTGGNMGYTTIPPPTCDGSAITLANAARTGGTATGTPPAAAGATEASG
jgi:hypothetical protein